MVERGDPAGDLAGLVVPLAGRLVATGDAVGAVPAAGRRRCERGRGRGVFRARAGGGPVGGDGPLVWHGSAALVPVLVGSGGGVGSGDPGRGPGFLPVAAGRWQASPAALARDGRGDAGGQASGRAYAPSVRAHSETVLRSFYDFHLRRARGRWSIRSRWTGRAVPGARMRTTTRWIRFAGSAAGLYRPVVASRIPRSVPDEEFNEIFAGWPRTGTGRWSRSTCSRGRGRRSCCRRPGAGWIQDGS